MSENWQVVKVEMVKARLTLREAQSLKRQLNQTKATKGSSVHFRVEKTEVTA